MQFYVAIGSYSNIGNHEAKARIACSMWGGKHEAQWLKLDARFMYIC